MGMPSFDIAKIDDVIHGRLRLGIMAYLAGADVADFNELKSVLKATQGNLSVQLRKLEDAGYIEIEKGFLGRKPLTRARPDGERPERLCELSRRSERPGGAPVARVRRQVRLGKKCSGADLAVRWRPETLTISMR